MKIKVKCYANEDVFLEDREAHPFKEDNRLAYFKDETGWKLTDIQTGMYVVTGHTKKAMLEAWEQKKLQYYELIKKDVYQKKVAEFERIQNL